MTDKPSLLVLQRFPYLKDQLPIKCSCGAQREVAKEFRTERFAGIETTPCDSCGLPAASLFTYLDADEMKKAADQILQIAELARSGAANRETP